MHQIHTKLQKVQHDIAVLHEQQKALKLEIYHHILNLLEKENAFSIHALVLLGALEESIHNTIKNLKKIDHNSSEFHNFKQRGQYILKKRKREKL